MIGAERRHRSATSRCGAAGRLAAVVVMAGLILAVGATGAASDPPLPFERAFAAQRGDRAVLRFNDFVGRIPDHRIKALLRSGAVLGDRVLLQEDVTVYFPDGHIVSSRLHIGEFRPRDGLVAQQVRHASHLQRDERFDWVGRFDSVLGPVCASGMGRRGPLEIRVRKDGVISAVSVFPGRFDARLDAPTESYTVVSAMDPVFLEPRDAVGSLLAECRRG